MVGKVLPRLPCYSISKEPSGRDDGEKEDDGDRDSELNDTDDVSRQRVLIEEGDVDCRTGGEGESDQKDDESTHEMRCVVPGCRDVAEFGEGGSEHDEGCDTSSQCDGTELHGGTGEIEVGGSVNRGRVECSVEPVD